MADIWLRQGGAIKPMSQHSSLCRPDRVTCGQCGTLNRAEWRFLEHPDVVRLNESKVQVHYAAGETLFMEGDPCTGVYCISSGRLVVRKTDIDGNSVLIRIAEAGETIGYRALLADEEHGTTAQAITPATACYIDRVHVRGFMARNPELAIDFARHIAADLRAAEDLFLRTATQRVRTRLAYVLLKLGQDRSCIADDGARVVELPVSRQDLAAMVGIRPETLARTIREFERLGLAEFAGRSVRIPQPTRLSEELPPGY